VTDHPPIGGRVDPRFRNVREAFVSNFTELDELGAGVCVRVDGCTVVDLWGGHRDRAATEPWRENTLVNIYSVGKGIVSALVLVLAERGLIDLDANVASLWPEFAAEGKSHVTVRALLAHRAGLPAVRRPLAADAMYDWDLMCRELASQRPYWEPNSTHGYHVNTFGFLAGELVRRVTDLHVDEALQRYLAGPAGADLHFGVPADQQHRAAEVLAPDVVLTTAEQWALAFPATGDAEHDFMIWHTYFNPSGLSGMGVVNTAAWRSSCIPSTSGHGDARALAAVFACLLDGAGTTTGRASPLVSPALLADATRTQSQGTDRVLGRPSHFGLGFQLPHPGHPLEMVDGAFGHMGYGGSLAFADPASGVAFGYVTNKPGERWHQPRPRRLIAALYQALG